jgi:chromosome segregation ATPase
MTANVARFLVSYLSYQEVADAKSLSCDEITSLKAEMGRRTADAERHGIEKREADLMLLDLKGEIQRLNGTFRELEMTASQQAIDSARLEHELERSKLQLEQKDIDLRTTMASLTEERLVARVDMNALQTRITLLEQERLETVSQLAGKREECLSTGRELVQLREFLTALESKVENTSISCLLSLPNSHMFFVLLICDSLLQERPTCSKDRKPSSS